MGRSKAVESAGALRLRGARAGNLQQLDLDLPHGHWTALHGRSGAGKSALLFGVLEPVSRRRFRILSDPAALPSGDESWLAPLAARVDGLQPVLAAAGEVPRGRSAVEVGSALDLWTLLAAAWSRHGGRRCQRCGLEWRAPDRDSLVAEITAAASAGDAVFVYSAVAGAAPAELLAAGWTRVRLGAGLARLEEAPDPLPPDAWLLLERMRWSPERGARLAEACAEALRRGGALRWEAGASAREHPPAAQCRRCGARVPPRQPEELLALRDAPDVVLHGRDWGAWCAAPLEDWLALPAQVLAGANRRLRALVRTGLGHLSATRTLGTLSLGEARRLELVALLSQVRREQLVLFDEPGMGLHGAERAALAALLRELVAQGNTVLTADPAREFLEAADGWVLLGPGAGPEGGRVVAQGRRAALPPEEPWTPPQPQAPEPGVELRFRGLAQRYLDIPELRLPLRRLVAVVGVSGSGKSTLLEDVLAPRLREERDFEGALPDGGVAVLLERALGHAVFSTIATLSGAADEIRAAFAGGEEGRIRGLTASDLVAMPGKGACAVCAGHGQDADGIACSACAGLGLRPDLQELRLRERTLREWLVTPLSRLEKRLPAQGRLRALARALSALGLGGRCFGERGRHLSLGERSRIALARALAGARRGRPKLFLLDEPCLGLPDDDARNVVELLRTLAAEGHSFWVVDHHEVLVRSADWLVELGPGAGPRGGRLLYAGPPAGVIAAGTPTGLWLQVRQQAPPAPPPPLPHAPPRSEALGDSWRREGRRTLEEALLRELATRSPLLMDSIGGSAFELRPADGADPAPAALPPTAWPVEAPRDATLLQVLGLEGRVEEALRGFGKPACVHCGGRGPWTELAQALLRREEGALAPGEWTFSTPLLLPEKARGSEAALLRAAGFRQLLRDGASLALADGVEPRPEDEVWLDRFDPRTQGGVGRIPDLEHQARLLGGGELRARRDGAALWRYRAGSCRDCGQGDLERPAALEHRLAGRSRAALAQAPLEQALAHLERHAPTAGPFAAAAEQLAGTSLLRRPGSTRAAALTRLERRAARLAGWLLFPLPGVVLLHDQPLSGLPPELARRWADALLRSGTHRFTDPEGYAGAHGARRGSGAAPALQGFSLELDLDRWGVPKPAEADTLLRDALELAQPLADQYLRSEEARLRGWTRKDLQRRPGGRVCSTCHGRGASARHPELWIPCAACAGSGWARETAALEIRSLRWPDLGGATVGGLAAHFADTPALARRLQAAAALGFGPVPLDTPLRRLPLGARALAPLAAWIGGGRELDGLRLAAPAAGLTPGEAEALFSTMMGYLSVSGVETPEWREHHPILTNT